MKKGDKFFLWSIGSCLVVGLALITSGFLFGGATQAKELFNDKFVLIDKPYLKMSTKINNGTLVKSNTTETIPLASIKNLNINMAIGDITIKTASTDEFKISLEGDNGLHYYEENNTLYITENNKNFDGEVELILPANTTFDNATFNIDAADLTLSDLNCNTLNLAMGAGEANIEKVDVNDNAVISIGAGELDIKKASFNNADIELGMGEFDFKGTITGNLNLDCGMGEASLELDDAKENHTISTDCALGAINVDGSTSVAFGNKIKEEGNSSSVYNISCGMGSVDIDFNK